MRVRALEYEIKLLTLRAAVAEEPEKSELLEEARYARAAQLALMGRRDG